jgi:hypothetical protein
LAHVVTRNHFILTIPFHTCLNLKISSLLSKPHIKTYRLLLLPAHPRELIYFVSMSAFQFGKKNAATWTTIVLTIAALVIVYLVLALHGIGGSKKSTRPFMPPFHHHIPTTSPVPVTNVTVSTGAETSE